MAVRHTATGVDVALTGQPLPVRASERVNRSLAVAIGVGGLCYGLLEVPEIVHQAALVAAWWTMFATFAYFGSCLLLSYLALRGSFARARVGLAVVAVAPVFVYATYPLSGPLGALDGQSLWAWRVMPVGILAATMIIRTAGAAAYLLFVNAVAAVVNCYATGDWGFVDFVQYFVRSVCASSVFTWALASAIRAAAVLDDASDRAERMAARAAATAARARERDRFAALIHDGVLSTLLDASRGQESRSLARQASRTVVELNEFRSESHDRSQFDATAAIGYLRVAAQQTAPGARFSAQRSTGSNRFRIPVVAAEVIVSALTEAVRNSLRHAGGDRVEREIVAYVDARRLRVQIVDDGTGFAVDAVPAHRLGIAVSIRGRMSALSGGCATVVSQPGEGTIVTLDWERADDLD